MEEALPLCLFRSVVGKFSRERKRRRLGDCGATTGEGGADGGGQRRTVKRELMREDQQVVEVFHACIGYAQAYHRLELLRYHRLLWIDAQMRLGQIKQCREVSLLSGWRDDIAEADIGLHAQPRRAKQCLEEDADAAVFLLLADWSGMDGSWQKGEPIVPNRERADLAKNLFHASYARRPEAEEIQITGGAVGMPFPERKQQRPLEDEHVGVWRLAQAIEETLQRTAHQHILHLLALCMGKRRQAAAYRGCHVAPSAVAWCSWCSLRARCVFITSIGHMYPPYPARTLSDARYGRMTLATRQTFA